MFEVNGALDAVFLGCFLFGLVFSVVLLVVGDAGIGGDVSGHAGADVGGLSAINLSTVLAFVAWFGGVGYLARQGAGWPAVVSGAVGVVGGLAGAAAVTWFLTRVVAPNDKALDPEDYRLPGTIARVTSSIRAGGTGEVVYEQAGVRQVSAARAADGRAIPHGAEVVVLESEAGIALVERADKFFADEGLEPVAVRAEGSGAVGETGT